MGIAITTASIIAIAGFVWLVNRILPFTICPICAGVFLTWAWLVIAHFLGYQINLVVPALLMGGSVVGVAYQFEKKFSNSSAKAMLFWKTLFIPAGFVAAYGVLEQLWIVFLITTVFLFSVSLLFVNKASSRNRISGDLEKKMENCC
jgi:hypothetical protein